MESRRVLPEVIIVYSVFDDVGDSVQSFFTAGLSAMGWVKDGDPIDMKCRVCGTVVDRNTVGIVLRHLQTYVKTYDPETIDEFWRGTIDPSMTVGPLNAMPVCPTENCSAVGWNFFQPA